MPAPDTAAPTSPEAVTHAHLANAIRALSMDAVEQAKSGHPGMPMGMADVATVLFGKVLKYDPSVPNWADRDRFVLSAGHGSMLLYSLAYLTGYEHMTLDEIKAFRQLGAVTAGHPEVDPVLGIEMTTGPLGQGIATAVGMALAERMLNARFGDGLVDHHTYVVASDGDLMEGVSHEACSLAGHLKLDRLIVLYDDNGISIDGGTDLSFSEDAGKRFEAYGWDVQTVDGHEPAAIEKALLAAKASDTPSLIRCKTTIGFGAPTKAGQSSSHGSPLGADEIAGARAALNWPWPPFEVPDSILQAWRDLGARGSAVRRDWEARLGASDQRDVFEATLSGEVPESVGEAIAGLRRHWVAEAPKLATRQASGAVLEALAPLLPTLVGGSADLTPSNNTRVKGSEDVAPGAFGGRYLRFGVREHGMVAALNGLALHGGFLPYGATFLVFTDYCRPSIRLAALMEQRVVLVMTHDSIGLGEDGPTHQPIEHLASLRAIPNVRVFRPADAVETAECWQAALDYEDGPSVLALTRQGVPTLRSQDGPENLSARGAYEVLGAAAEEEARVTLLATGSEVTIAVEARQLLEADGIGTRVISMPCLELFEQQDDAYKDAVLGDGCGHGSKPHVRIAVEAGSRQGWDRYVGRKGTFVGMSGFGASAPYQDLYKRFNITAAAIAEAARKTLGLED